MASTSQIRTGRHVVYALHVHLVFVTKYRHRVFSDRHLTRLEAICREVCADFEADLVEFNGEADHAHLLVAYPPKVAVSRLVNSLKGVSSRLLRREFPELERHYWRAQRLRSASYFAGSSFAGSSFAGSSFAGSVGGAPLHTVREYIEGQRRPT